MLSLNARMCGVWAGLYLVKLCSLPHFLAHFIIFVLLHYRGCPAKVAMPRLMQFYGVALLRNGH